MSLEQGAGQGAKTLIVGVANSGGFLPDHWVQSIVRAIELGMDVASGLHVKLGEVEPIRQAAERHGRSLFDVRHPSRSFATGTGVKRSRFVGNLWFLNFLTCRREIRKLARVRRASLLKLPAIGSYYADRIQAWQQDPCFGPDARLVGEMIRQDAMRILELNRQVKSLEDEMARIAARPQNIVDRSRPAGCTRVNNLLTSDLYGAATTPASGAHND